VGEVGVAREQGEIVLERERGDPRVVVWEWLATAA
jgi:hypothetical protein